MKKPLTKAQVEKLLKRAREGVNVTVLSYDYQITPRRVRQIMAEHGVRRRSAGKPPEILKFREREHTVDEWAAITGLTKSCIKNRLRAGWTIEEALTKPSPHRLERMQQAPMRGLTDEQAIEARAKYAAGSTYEDLSKEYGLCTGTLGRYVRGEVGPQEGRIHTNWLTLHMIEFLTKEKLWKKFLAYHGRRLRRLK